MFTGYITVIHFVLSQSLCTVVSFYLCSVATHAWISQFLLSRSTALRFSPILTCTFTNHTAQHVNKSLLAFQHIDDHSILSLPNIYLSEREQTHWKDMSMPPIRYQSRRGLANGSLYRHSCRSCPRSRILDPVLACHAVVILALAAFIPDRFHSQRWYGWLCHRSRHSSSPCYHRSRSPSSDSHLISTRSSLLEKAVWLTSPPRSRCRSYTIH
jgi:hypothetical protein